METMPPRGVRKQRYNDVGEVGRHTGIAPPSNVPRNSDGLEDPDAFFNIADVSSRSNRLNSDPRTADGLEYRNFRPDGAVAQGRAAAERRRLARRQLDRAEMLRVSDAYEAYEASESPEEDLPVEIPDEPSFFGEETSTPLASAAKKARRRITVGLGEFDASTESAPMSIDEGSSLTPHTYQRRQAESVQSRASFAQTFDDGDTFNFDEPYEEENAAEESSAVVELPRRLTSHDLELASSVRRSSVGRSSNAAQQEGSSMQAASSQSRLNGKSRLRPNATVDSDSDASGGPGDLQFDADGDFGGDASFAGGDAYDDAPPFDDAPSFEDVISDAEDENELPPPRKSKSAAKKAEKGDKKRPGRPRGRPAGSRNAPSNTYAHDFTREDSLNPQFAREFSRGTTVDPETGVRRSHRRKIRPLEYWRNERVIYKRRKSGFGVEDVVRIPKSDEAHPNRRRGHARKPSVKREYSAEYQQEEELAGIDRDTPVAATVWDWENDTETVRDIARPRHTLNPQKSGKNGNFQFEKFFSDGNNFASGILNFEPRGSKALRSSGDNAFVFFVHKGAAKVQVHESQFEIGVGGAFFVPKGNLYSIEALGKGTTQLFFSQARKIYVLPEGGVDDESELYGQARAEED